MTGAEEAPELSAEPDHREMFDALETLDADPLGVPKPIEFVERLASGRRSELSIELRRWVDHQAKPGNSCTATVLATSCSA